MNEAPKTEQAVAAVKFDKFTIETDGTKAGTKMLLNGKAVANISSLSFYWYDSIYCPISLSYTVSDQNKHAPGTLAESTTYRLRCPDMSPAYATKAEASTDAVPAQMEFEFAKASVDQALLDHEAECVEFARVNGRSRYALLR
jgi:hypothetical protein